MSIPVNTSSLFCRVGLAIAMVAATGCAGSGSPATPAGQSKVPQTASQVAVFGDVPSELAKQIAEAKSQGQNPIYLTVRAVHQQYLFSVYAQVLQTHNALIVRAYNKLYVFPLNNSKLYYGADSKAVSDIPLVENALIDAAVSGRQAGTFITNVAVKRDICPDCVMLLYSRVEAANFSEKWNGLSDSWQIQPTYTAYIPTSGGMRPMDCTGMGPLCGHPQVWYCYSVADAPGGNGALVPQCDKFSQYDASNPFSGAYAGHPIQHGPGSPQVAAACQIQNGVYVSPTGGIFCSITGGWIYSGTPVGG